jgi:hypothetical protein
MDSGSIGKIPYGYIYISFFPPTKRHPVERFYIGQRKFSKRNGFSFNQNYHGSGRAVYDYIKANPNEIIRTVCLLYAYSQKELNRLEDYWVSFKIKGKEYPDSFNLRSGGMQSGCSEETRRLLSRKRPGRLPLTKEHKAKLSKALKGHSVSESTRQIKRQSQLEKWGNPDVRDHLWIANKKRKDIICLESGKVFRSSRDATKYYINTSASAIIQCCKGLRKRTGGLHWMFLSDYNRIFDPKVSGNNFLDFSS